MAKSIKTDNSLSLEQQLCSAIWDLPGDPSTNEMTSNGAYSYNSLDYLTIKSLISEKADVNFIDQYGWSPLHLALRKGKVEIAELLHHNNAKIDQVSVNNERKTPADIINEKGLLNAAAWNQDKTRVDELISLGANVDNIDQYGWSPLHLALRKGCLFIAELLLNANAKTDQVSANDEHKTAMDMISEMPRAGIEYYSTLKELYDSIARANILAKYDNGSEVGMNDCIKSSSYDDMVELLRALDPEQKTGFIDKMLVIPTRDRDTLLASKIVELLDASDGSNSSIMYCLFRLPQDILTPILNESAKLLGICNKSKFSFIYDLFKLPDAILTPVFENNQVVFLLEASGEFKRYFIESLFELSSEILLPILKDNLIKMFYVAGETTNKLLDQLLQLPDTSLKLIFNEELLCNLAYTPYIDFTSWQALCKKTDMPVPKIDTQYCNHNSKGLEFLKTTAPLIENLSVEEISQLNPVIKTLLSKTYCQILKTEERTDFLKKLVKALAEVMETEECIAKIIENAANTEGNFFISQGSILSGGEGCQGLYSKSNIFVSISNKSISCILNTLVHESTHKLIDLKFSNRFLPYTKDDNSYKLIALEMEKELKVKVSQDSKSWLEDMAKKYSAEDYACEILPHFTGNMAQSILEQKNTAGVSEEFCKLIWDYLNKQLFDNLDYKLLPELYYHHEEQEEYCIVDDTVNGETDLMPLGEVDYVEIPLV